MWRSLVSRLVRVQEAAGSNPATPTTKKPTFVCLTNEGFFERSVPLPRNVKYALQVKRTSCVKCAFGTIGAEHFTSHCAKHNPSQRHRRCFTWRSQTSPTIENHNKLWYNQLHKLEFVEKLKLIHMNIRSSHDNIDFKVEKEICIREKTRE